MDIAPFKVGDSVYRILYAVKPTSDIDATATMLAVISISNVAMDIAAFKVGLSVGCDKDATTPSC
jgi:hypothetical protein